MEPGSEEQMADRHAVASGEENQHEENRTRGIHIGKEERRHEEPSDKLRRTVRFEQEAPNTSTSSSSTSLVSPEYLSCEWCETNFGQIPSWRKVQVMLITTYKFLRWMCCVRWMDERVTSKKCWTGVQKKIPEISRYVH